MLKRIITGAVLIGVVVGFFFLRKTETALFLIFVELIAVLGGFEISRAFSARTLPQQKAVSFAFSALLIPFYYGSEYFFGYGLESALLLIILSTALLLGLLVFQHKTVNIENTGLSFIAMLYPSVLLLPMAAACGFDYEKGLLTLILFFALPSLADTFAYLVGITVKGKKLCPEISPKKTVSGFVGGLSGGVLGGILAFLFFGQITGLDTVLGYLVFGIMGIAVALLTAFGDLVESMLKRNLKIKDMGNILPGHGGVLDRIDGILFACPVIYIIAALFF